MKKERIYKMLKTSRTILRVVFIGFVLIFAIVKIFDIKPKEIIKEKRVRHVDHTTSEFDELW